MSGKPETPNPDALNAEIRRVTNLIHNLVGYRSHEIPCPHCGAVQDFSGESLAPGGVWDCGDCERPFLLKGEMYFEVEAK